MGSSAYVRKTKTRVTAGRILILTAAAAALLAVLTSAAVRKPIAAMAEERVREQVSRAVTAAAAEAIGENGLGLLEITQTGEESFIITADAEKLNLLALSVTALAQERISALGREGASVELGTASGLMLLSGKGPVISVAFRQTGSVTYSVAPSLRSAGINQSLFTVDLTLTARILIPLAGMHDTLIVTNTVPLCQTVVVGKVPQVYTNVANEDDMLNLIPTDLP